MGKLIYIDGGLVATTGDLYARNIVARCSCQPDNSEKITVNGDYYEIKEDTGSVFDTYYVRDFVTAGGSLGVSKGAICAFADIYEFTVRDYDKGLKLLKSMLNCIPEGEQMNLYLQQQYASVFSLLEHFLSCSFIRQTCDREESYHRVLSMGLLQQRFGNKSILNGPDCLEKELLFIELANKIVYHRPGDVYVLFEAAFGIRVDLSPLKRQLIIRNDIMHRFGHTKRRHGVILSAATVWELIEVVDQIVRNTANQILALPPSGRA